MRLSVPEPGLEVPAAKDFSVIATAEAISLLANSMSLAGSFGDGRISDGDLTAALRVASVDSRRDMVETVVR